MAALAGRAAGHPRTDDAPAQPEIDQTHDRRAIESTACRIALVRQDRVGDEMARDAEVVNGRLVATPLDSAQPHDRAAVIDRVLTAR